MDSLLKLGLLTCYS